MVFEVRSDTYELFFSPSFFSNHKDLAGLFFFKHFGALLDIPHLHHWERQDRSQALIEMNHAFYGGLRKVTGPFQWIPPVK